jgi:hypothetical protein
MMWTGSWRNQYGSRLEITDESNGRIAGWFRSEADGRIKGHEIAIVGVYQNNLISFVLNGAPHTNFVASWTGLLYEGRIETLFNLVAGERLTAETEGSPARNKPLKPFEATTTGADFFERIS